VPDDDTDILVARVNLLASQAVDGEPAGPPCDARGFLTPEDELLLVARARSGDTAAAAELLHAHRGFIYAVVRRERWRAPHADLDDLMQAGRAGFLDGVARFDASLGYRLGTYVAWHVRHHVQEECRRQFPVVLPADIRGERCKKAAARVRRVVSVERLCNPDDEDTMPLPARSRECRFERDELDALEQALGRLPARYAQVVSMRHLLELTIRETAVRMGITKTRVGQLLAKAMPRLKSAVRNSLRAGRRQTGRQFVER